MSSRAENRRAGVAELLADDAPLFSPMMSVITEEHEPLRRSLRVWARSQEADIASWEDDGHVPTAVIRSLAETGAFRDRWRPGRAMGLPAAILLASETSLMTAGLSLAVVLHSELFIGTLHQYAKTDGQRELLERALDGTIVGCFASTEPSGGSDVLAAKCTITPDGDQWILTGEKRYTSNAGRATHALVVARSPSVAGGRGLVLVVVALDRPGVKVAGFFPKLGTDACDTAKLEFSGVRLDADAMLCPPGIGLLGLVRLLQYERIAISAQLVSAGHVAVRGAMAHLRRREQFGVKLSTMQALRHRLADAMSEVWACESMLSGVASSAMAGRQIGPVAAALKLRCAAMAWEVADEWVQLLGGRGYSSNFPAERMLRDVRLARIGAGADELMRETIALTLDRHDESFDRWLAALDAADLPVSPILMT